MSSGSPSNDLICPKCGEVYEDRTRGNCPADGTTLQEFVVPEQEDDDPLLGETIDRRFAVQEILGEGAMARVYRASQLSVNRTVALKTLRTQVRGNRVLVKRFYREAQVISDGRTPR